MKENGLREILEQYKSAPISIKQVDGDKIKIVYPIDTASSQIIDLIIGKVETEMWYCPKCNKFDFANSKECIAKPEHIPYRGVDMGSCKGEMIPLISLTQLKTVLNQMRR